jgi:hypothetical protein
METATLLDLPAAEWYTEIVLRERDKGVLDNVSWTEKNEKYSHELELRKRDAFFWAPPGKLKLFICNLFQFFIYRW